MSEIIGYGEDALTLSVLVNESSVIKFLKILHANKKDSIERQLKTAHYIYRPSFGRNKKSLGEFDAIISTDTKVFLIESKWYKSGELTNGKVNLRSEQVMRHKIFSEMIEKIAASKTKDNINNITAVYEEYKPKLKNILETQLFKNMDYLLPYLLNNKKGHSKGIVRNVILLFVPEEQKKILKQIRKRDNSTQNIDGTKFIVRAMTYKAEKEKGFIKITL